MVNNSLCQKENEGTYNTSSLASERYPRLFWKDICLAYTHKWLLSTNNPSPLDSLSLRRELVKQYSFAIPSPEALDALEVHAPIVEMGAGSGYWAYLLRSGNVEVSAFDACVQGNKGYFFHKTWTDVIRSGTPVLEDYPDYTLFLCWPPYKTAMAANCLKHYRGSTVIYIGESEGGCTGTRSFRRLLEKEFDAEKRVIIPCWETINDSMEIWRRRCD
jgi:hypothetical protein